MCIISEAKRQTLIDSTHMDSKVEQLILPRISLKLSVINKMEPKHEVKQKS